MGMGYAAYHADVIEWDDIKKLVPVEAAEFEKRLATAGVSMSDFCYAESLEDWDVMEFSTEDEDAIQKAVDQIADAWEKLAESFTAATTVDGAGLELEPRYHDPDDGGRYDGVENGFFGVEGVYQLTPAGKKYEDIIDHRGWVEFV